MHYDPIKNRLSALFTRTPFLRKVFYRILDLMLLRSWHIRREIRAWSFGRTPDQHVLDAGTGYGQYSWFMTRKFPNWSILAVDINPDQLEECRRFFEVQGCEKVALRQADLTRFTAEDPFDLIISVDVMEHIEDDNAVFRNFCSSLREGGMLLISTPSDRGGSDVHGEGDASFIGEHVRDGYNVEAIANQLRNAGFDEVSVRYSYGPAGKISWVLTMKIPMRLAGTSRLFLLLFPFYFAVILPVCMLLNHLDLKMNYSSGTGLIVRAFKTPKG